MHALFYRSLYIYDAMLQKALGFGLVEPGCLAARWDPPLFSKPKTNNLRKCKKLRDSPENYLNINK